MFRKIALFTAIALGSVLPATAPHAQPAEQVIQPGYWKYELRALLFINDVDFRCVRPQDVQKFLAPCNRHYTCTYSVQDIANGQARYEGIWAGKTNNKRIPVSATGTYSAKSFQLNATVRAGGIPIPGKITATWQSGTCPPGAEPV